LETVGFLFLAEAIPVPLFRPFIMLLPLRVSNFLQLPAEKTFHILKRSHPDLHRGTKHSTQNIGFFLFAFGEPIAQGVKLQIFWRHTKPKFCGRNGSIRFCPCP
jgi:hypothetical protein